MSVEPGYLKYFEGKTITSRFGLFDLWERYGKNTHNQPHIGILS